MTALVLTPPPSAPTPKILQWAGGKAWLAPNLTARILPLLRGAYFEPFLGSGAVFFSLRAHGWQGEAVLGDALPDLICLYEALQEGLAAGVSDFLRLYERLERPDPRAFYEEIRALFNGPGPRSKEGNAADVVYLNQRCFNGLWRTNRKGEFNTAWGGERDNPLPSLSVLQEMACALRSARLIAGDFSETIAAARAGSVIYADPPYVDTFTGYTGGFSDADQARLRDCLLAARQRGAHVFASNSDAPLVRALYAGWEIEALSVRYAVGGKAKSRKPATEVLIYGGPL